MTDAKIVFAGDGGGKKPEKTKGETWLDIGQGWLVRYEVTDTWLDFEAFECTGIDTDGGKWFAKKGRRSSDDETDEPEKAEPTISGFVKWDGCSEMTLGRPHFCGAQDVADRAGVMVELHKLALLIPRVDRDCAGYGEVSG